MLHWISKVNRFFWYKLVSLQGYWYSKTLLVIYVYFHFFKLTVFSLCLKVGHLWYPHFSTHCFMFSVSFLSVYTSCTKIQYLYKFYLNCSKLSTIGLKNLHKHANVSFHYDRTRQTYFFMTSFFNSYCFFFPLNQSEN